MDPLSIVWFSFSIIIFIVGIFVYRKGLYLRTDVGVSQVVVNEVNISQLVEEDEVSKITMLYNESLMKIEQLTQERNDQDHRLKENLNLVHQLESEEQIIVKEKDTIVNRLIEEKKIIAEQCEDVSRKSVELESKLQEAIQTIQSLKNEFIVKQSLISEEDLQRSLQKSITLVKELKDDNECLLQANAMIQQKLDQLESANQNLENKEQQLQYELVKSRAQLLGFEQICDDLKKKIEQSVLDQG